MAGPGRPKTPIRQPGQRGRLKGQKMKKKRGITFKRQIYTLIKAMKTQASIKQSAMEVLDNITIEIFKRIARQASDLCEHGKSKVLNAKTLEAAVKMTIPGEMAQYAIEQAQEAVLKYQQYEAPSSSSA